MPTSCYAIIGCLLGAIICLFITLYSICNELKEVKSDKEFYEKCYYSKLEDIKNYIDKIVELSVKLDRYETIFEKIKESLPF